MSASADEMQTQFKTQQRSELSRLLSGVIDVIDVIDLNSVTLEVLIALLLSRPALGHKSG
jgi:hypothetical protein